MQKITRKNQENIESMVGCFELFVKFHSYWSKEVTREKVNLKVLDCHLERAVHMADCAVYYAEQAGLDPLKVIHHAKTFADLHNGSEKKSA